MTVEAVCTVCDGRDSAGTIGTLEVVSVCESESDHVRSVFAVNRVVGRDVCGMG